MKLTTQDGRTLELDHKYNLNTWTISNRTGREKALIVTLEEEDAQLVEGHHNWYWVRNEILDEAVGYFATLTSRQKAAQMLIAAWKSGASEFTVPQDTFEKTGAEKFNEFCEEHGLTCVLINELGYNNCDTARNAHIWRTTDEFERRNILVADLDNDYDINAFGGVYAKSLVKWQKLQAAKHVVPFKLQSPAERRNTRLAVRKKAVSL